MKAYTVSKKINGKEYKAQFTGLSTYLRAVDNSYIDGTQNTSIEKLAKFIFEHVIVEPRNLEIDDFETLEEYNEVVNFGRDVAQGKFRDKADKPEGETKGKE